MILRVFVWDSLFEVMGLRGVFSTHDGTGQESFVPPYAPQNSFCHRSTRTLRFSSAVQPECLERPHRTGSQRMKCKGANIKSPLYSSLTATSGTNALLNLYGRKMTGSPRRSRMMGCIQQTLFLICVVSEDSSCWLPIPRKNRGDTETVLLYGHHRCDRSSAVAVRWSALSESKLLFVFERTHHAPKQSHSTLSKSR